MLLNKCNKIIFSIAVILFSAFFGVFAQTNRNTEDIQISYNGRFLHKLNKNQDYNNTSENGIYACKYEIIGASDEIQILSGFEFFEKGKQLYELKKPEGSGIYISNSGFLALIDFSNHFKGQVEIHFYSKSGKKIFSRIFREASLFGFSDKGNNFGVGCSEGFGVITLSDLNLQFYEKADKFSFSENEEYLAVALGDKITIYQDGKAYMKYMTGFVYPRDVVISLKNNIVAVVDKKELKAFSLKEGEVIFMDKLSGKNSYRDLLYKGGKLFAGIHFRNEGVSKGFIKSYDAEGKSKVYKKESVKEFNVFRTGNESNNRNSKDYVTIPWPFTPFNEMHTVWNYYETLMASYYYSPYCHQGLDIIVPVDEPIYSVQKGIVKCVLTTGGEGYWRIAISPTQSSGYSNGWLYAHLVENSIQFDVGDTVELHDYLGDIIHWYSNWGHVHFVEIRDHGNIWRYDDGQWGINFNPLLALEPHLDSSPPEIQTMAPSSKFGIFVNNSDLILSPDDVYGDIDFVVRVDDYIGTSTWTQPAYETFYTIKKVSGNEIIQPRTLGHRLNHSYDTYTGSEYENAASIMFKYNTKYPALDWFTQNRNYYQNLTNSNGDDILSSSEKNNSFSTTAHEDGDYRIIVEIFDAYGNMDQDSMDFTIKNNATGISLNEEFNTFALQQNVPNPFSSETRIDYQLPNGYKGEVVLNIMDAQGKVLEKKILVNNKGGINSICLDRNDLPSGFYFYSINAGDYFETKKMCVAD